MLPEDIRIVQEHAQPKGIDFSSSLRIIVREWAEMKRLRVVGIGSLPRPVDAAEGPVILAQVEQE
jgi:hypothetical protein